MTFIAELNRKLECHSLLNHPFYQAWTHGELSRETLQVYAREYYHHVAAFPRYISAIHSRCDDLPARQVLLGNLVEEEQGADNHPELWQRFAEGLGVARPEMTTPPQLDKTQELVQGYFDLVEDGYATGLGALYAYERQTPGVSLSKIEGLKKFYDINDEKTLSFFSVHMQADEWHTAECAALIEKLDAASRAKAEAGAETGVKLLWGFLDGMMAVHAA